MPKKIYSKKTPKAKDVVFVGVNNPNEVRLRILESAKDTFEAMKLFQEIKQIRKQKTELKNQLRKQLRTMSIAYSKIMSALPKVQVHMEQIEKSEKIISEKQTPKLTTPPSQRTELEKIATGLREIEEKLASLG